MKKFLLSLSAIAFMLTLYLPVSAAGSGTVTELSATATTSAVTVSGKTSNVNAAVAVQVLDSSKNVLAMESFVVLGNSFSGNMDVSLTSGATYTIRVADYDGGTWTKTTATATAPTTPGDSDTTDGDGSGGSSGPAGDTLDQVREKIKNAGSGATVTCNGVTTLPNDIMRKLAERGDVTLVMEYTYKGVNYRVVIPAGAAMKRDDIPWYGPLYLASLYGNSAGSGATVYVVKKGDTLNQIAKAHGLTLAQLLALNPDIKNINLIHPGQKIIVGYSAAAGADGDYYTVQQGDYLYKIARIHNITYSKLVSLNPGINEEKYIYPKQRIRVK